MDLCYNTGSRMDESWSFRAGISRYTFNGIGWDSIYEALQRSLPAFELETVLVVAA